jgi:hypothetical protein
VTLFLNTRGASYGAVVTPLLLEGDAVATPPQLSPVPEAAISSWIGGKSVLLATHGFNVNLQDGARSLGRLETMIAPRPSERVIGVLWPGDFVIPAINYPFTEKIAAHAGQLVGDFCNRYLGAAARLSFVSHSLGARVVLEAIQALKRRAYSLCIAAGAVGADCFAVEYAAAAKNCDSVVTLSSMADLVLELAYPPGDLIADLFDWDHKAFERALGRRGPETPFGSPITAAQIPDQLGYDHGDYMPPGDLAQPVPDPNPNTKWPRATAFLANAFRGERQPWP